MTVFLIATLLFTIDERYHTFDEVAHELDSFAQQHPTIAKLDTIGFSTTDSLPIFAMKLSDNVHVNEDEPEVLYVGCHHAEEILGIEICMYMIGDLLSKYNADSAITYWVNNREIWFVPLLNPEGHDVVMSHLDTTWRKNKRDNNDNGIFDLDYDGMEAHEIKPIVDRLIKFYKDNNFNFEVWQSGGKGFHFHFWFKDMLKYNSKDRRLLREIFANIYNTNFVLFYLLVYLSLFQMQHQSMEIHS